MPPSRIARPCGGLAGGDVGRRDEIGRAVLQAPHREQHRAEHRGERQRDQHQPLVLGLTSSLRFSASAAASARRIASQRPAAAGRSVAERGQRISGDDERPVVHSAALRRSRASTFGCGKLGAHPHQHDRAEQTR